MKVIYYCWTCNKEYTKEDNELLDRGNARGIKCDCGGYIISPSGKVKFKIEGLEGEGADMKFKKLVKEDPQGNYETLHNMTTIKDREIYLRNFGTDGDISLVDYSNNECKRKCGRDIKATAEEFGEYMDCDCIVSVFYSMAIGYAELRAYLKAYEDTGISPDEVKKLCFELKCALEAKKGYKEMLKNSREELEELAAKNRELVELLKEVARLNVECCNWIYSPSLAGRIDKTIEKTETNELVKAPKREKWEFYCPCCDTKMKTRIEEVLSDAFVSGKEEIVTGWDCENCNFSLNVDEN